jgi:KaiC/GvpD/RAD55 family RecA-like ATPase
VKKQKITGISKNVAKCGNCGKEIYAFSERCEHCGIEFAHATSAECSVCNSFIPLSATECTKCGASFERKVPDVETMEEEFRHAVDRVHTIGKEVKKSVIDIEELEKREALTDAREKELNLKESKMKDEIERIERELAQKYSKDVQDKLESVLQKEREVKEKEERLKEAAKEIEAKAEARLKEKEEQLRKTIRDLELREKLLKETLQPREAKILKKRKGGETDREEEDLLEKKEEEVRRLNEEIMRLNTEVENIKEPLRYKEDELNRREKDLRYRDEMLKVETDRFLQEKAQIGSNKESLKERELEDRLKLLEEEVKHKENELKEREEYLKSREEELNIMQQRIIEKEIGTKRVEKEEELKRNKISTGTQRLDDLLLGGIPPGSNVFVYGPTFVGKEVFLSTFVADGLKKGVPTIFVTTDNTPASIKQNMTEILPNYEDYEKTGLVRYVDIYSKRMDIKDEGNGYINLVEYGENGIMKPTVEKAEYEIKEPQQDVQEKKVVSETFIEYIYSIKNIDAIMQAIINAQKSVKKYGYYRMIFPLSTISVYIDRVTMFRFIQRICNEVKTDKSVAFYSLNSDMLPDVFVQTLRHPMDGVVEFKSENQRTFLCIRGLSDVQTRAWIQYTYTERGLVLGSFSLSRIR